MSASQFLSLVIMAAAIPAKVPQIRKIYQHKNGEGISIMSLTLELIAYAVYMSYSYVKDFPFYQWGDVLFLMIQTAIIAFLVLYYEGKRELATAYTLAFILMCVILMEFVPSAILWTLQSLNIGSFVVAKLLQAFANYRNGHTGQLSEITLSLLFFGALARVFTTMQETGDFIIILSNLTSCIANALLIAQIIYYWDVTKQKFA